MIIFSERQKFRQWWLWVLIVAALIVPLAITLIKQPSVKDIATELLIGAIVPLAIIILFLFMELRTNINEDGIYYRFFPLHLKVFILKWEEIDKAYIRQYSPITEYGGWGMRRGLGGKGRAYNISGNIGLQIELKTGQKILIGTQKADELRSTLEKLVKARVLKADVIRA